MNEEQPERAPDDLTLGDALALARLRWVDEAHKRVSASGYPSFKRSDTVVLRRLRRGPAALVEVAAVTGITRQAARKIVTDLQERGYVEVDRDAEDARRALVTLSEAGRNYADTLMRVARSMNHDATHGLEATDLEVVLRVLRALTSQWNAGT